MTSTSHLGATERIGLLLILYPYLERQGGGAWVQGGKEDVECVFRRGVGCSRSW
jgi:hypothetical protein